MLTLFLSVPALAKVVVQATVDRNEVALGEPFNLTVVVASEESTDVQEPRIPDLDGFDLLNSYQSTSVSQRLENTSSGMQFVKQVRKEFNYQFAPKRQGSLSISAFEVVVDGKVYNTQPIMIRVGGAGQHGAQRGPRPQAQPPGARRGMPFPDQDQMDEIDRMEEQMMNQFNQLLQQRGGGGGPGGFGGYGAAPGNARNLPDAQFRSLPTNPNEAFFISVEVDKTEVYEGEQVTVSWYIYTRGQMETLDRFKFPDLRGFWKEIIEEVPSIQFTEEIVNGVPYKKALLASHALFPIKAGTSVIDEYKIKSRVRLPSTQGFGGFALGKPFEFTKSSQRVKINVKPLPTDGRPKDFSGAVGQFDVHAGVENQTVPVNQPLNLKIRFEGAGNAKLIELPAIEWPPALEIYDTKSDAKFFKNGRSYKEFEVLVIPRQEGDLKIPVISVSMFDPQTKKYYTKTTQELDLKVVANPDAPSGSSARIGGVDDKSAKTPAVKAPPPGSVLPDLIMTWDKPSFWNRAQKPEVWLGLYGLVIAILLWKSKLELGWGRRRQNLRELVAKRYKKLDVAVKKNDFRAVGAEMTNLFNMVLASITGKEAAGFELEKMLSLIPPSLRREHGEDIKKQYEVFQVMTFAPEGALGNYKEPDQVAKNVSKGKDLIQKIIDSNPEHHETQES